MGFTTIPANMDGRPGDDPRGKVGVSGAVRVVLPIGGRGFEDCYLLKRRAVLLLIRRLKTSSISSTL
jgi:hypothetical protein